MGFIPVPRHWDPENLIVYYTTFSIKSWIPVSSTGMTSQGHWNFCFNICTLAMHLNRYIGIPPKWVSVQMSARDIMKSERVMWKFFRKYSTDMLNNKYITMSFIAKTYIFRNHSHLILQFFHGKTSNLSYDINRNPCFK